MAHTKSKSCLTAIRAIKRRLQCKDNNFFENSEARNLPSLSMKGLTILRQTPQLFRSARLFLRQPLFSSGDDTINSKLCEEL